MTTSSRALKICSLLALMTGIVLATLHVTQNGQTNQQTDLKVPASTLLSALSILLMIGAKKKAQNGK